MNPQHVCPIADHRSDQSHRRLTASAFQGEINVTGDNRIKGCALADDLPVSLPVVFVWEDSMDGSILPRCWRLAEWYGCVLPRGHIRRCFERRCLGLPLRRRRLEQCNLPQAAEVAPLCLGELRLLWFSVLLQPEQLLELLVLV
jgi:hypothetical protein